MVVVVVWLWRWWRRLLLYSMWWWSRRWTGLAVVVEVVEEVVVVKEMVKVANGGGSRDGRWSGRWWLVVDDGCNWFQKGRAYKIMYVIFGVCLHACLLIKLLKPLITHQEKWKIK